MRLKPARNDLLWMCAGAALLLVIMSAVLLFHREQNPNAQLTFKATRIDLVSQMRIALASASEAEKSAVLATTDEDSQTFADHARAASATVDKARQELATLLESGGTQEERDLLRQFAEAFTELRRIDEDLLNLAVKNTNLKAYSLDFGPAAEALREMDAALAHLITERATAPDAGEATALAYTARLGALRAQSMLPPHIAEEDDGKMNEIEARLASDEQDVGKALQALAALPATSHSPDLETAASRWARFRELEVQILALSRENTNVRSLAISQNRKRKVMGVCDGHLAALQQAIAEEPVTGTDYGRFGRPH